MTDQPFVVTIAASHACCRDLCFRATPQPNTSTDSHDNTNHHACDFLSQRATLSLYSSFLSSQLPSVHRGELFVMKHVNDLIPRAQMDFNRYSGRFTEWRTELHSKIKQSSLVLDIHSYASDTDAYQIDVTHDELLLLVYGDRNMPWVRRMKHHLLEHDIQCRMMHASQLNDILLVCESSSKHATIIAYNEQMTPDRLIYVNNIIATFVIKNFIEYVSSMRLTWFLGMLAR